MSSKKEFSLRVKSLSLAYTFLGLILIISSSSSSYVEAVVRKPEPIYVNEFFTMLITPDLFLPNTTSSSSTPSSVVDTSSFSSTTSSSLPLLSSSPSAASSQNEQFRYRPSLLGHPSLPSFMSFREGKRKNFGYLYGSATENYAGRKIDIEIIALNKSNYETSRIVIPMQIYHKKAPMNRIEMKFTNLDWVNLTNNETLNNLKSIFTDELWIESKYDLSVLFLESATKMGDRLPLNPNKSEGVIIYLGSNAKLSDRLMDLDREIQPLLKLKTCTFKKTTVQQLFHRLGFQLDWCAFRIVSLESEVATTATKEDEVGRKASMLSRKVWNSIARDDLPERNYSEEIAIAIAIPSVIFAFLVALLTVVLCFQHDKLNDDQYEIFLEDLFELCKPRDKVEETSEQPKSNNEPVQMVQYSGTSKNPPVTALKSLHDPYSDNLSLDSDSPSSNIFQEGSPKLNPYYRPNPPAYTGKMAKPLFLQFQEGPSTSSTVRFKNDI